MDDQEKLTDIIAERAVVSGIYQYGEEGLLDVLDILQNETFTDEINQAIFKALKYLYEKHSIKNFDRSSLMSALKELQLEWVYERPENVKHIKAIINSKVKQENIKTWAAQIRKLQIARLLYEQLQGACVDVQNIKGSEPISQILGIAETAIFDFSSLLDDKTNEPKQIADGLREFLKQVEEHPTEIVGISSGLPYYDKAIGGGFRRKTVSLVGARQKTGKSMLAVNIALHVSQKLNIPTLYLDTEMDQQDHWMRTLANLIVSTSKVKITIDEIETGKYVKNEFKHQKIYESLDILEKLPFDYINISGKPFEETLSLIRKWLMKKVGQDETGKTKPCLIIYDYLKMMSGDSLSDALKEYQVLGFMTTAMHNFAVRYNIPFLTFTQLNRDGIDKESSGIISGSDKILDSVTNFTVYKVKSDEEISENGPQHGNRKLVPICARHGQGMEYGDYINVLFDGKYGKITEGETRSSLKKRANNPQLSQSMNVDIKDDETIKV